jgi:hypothetical protein
MIPRLEDLSVGYRIIITFCIVLAILFSLALIGYLTGGWDQAQGEIVASTKYDARMIELDKVALDSAYHQQILLLFSVWLKDGAGQDAARIRNGLQIARRAYVQAATQLEERERKVEERK